MLGVSQRLSPTAPAERLLHDGSPGLRFPTPPIPIWTVVSSRTTAPSGDPLCQSGRRALLRTSSSTRKATKQLAWSRVDNRAEVTWTQLLPGYDTEVVGGEVIGDLAVIATRQTLVGLDVATGAIRYNVGL